MAAAKKAKDELHEPRFPNLDAVHKMDHEDHVKAAMKAGLSREAAEKHAEEEEREDVG